ncbi:MULTISPECIES: AEC family transporter [Halomonas]|uniref:AEC family transporter n=3 Tax=Halomonas TaxID=2745 RepID=A0AAU7KEU0_9GAMM|nr:MULTISPECIES: AEC family transporter [Halomonas]MBR9770406.1 AEC family transporter [Gammaproteobacteria bacterium]HAR09934.1 AEC family transporter [Cobetia sp.]KJZ16859.1 transporter [Halomonas sp. S2151]MBS8269465.1 AEC family transporter [Halomonas litopenaei]MBY5943564.1 AEC family transporter [Halomonas sp. DP5N14-9]|tara:strand:+ start:1165 stop:2040 length:876 start_codon:yes stop_codon:yes gene_type:complete
MFAQLFAVMAPVITGAGLGFFWIRRGFDYPVAFVTKLVFNIGTPALVIASLAGAEIDASSFGRTMLAAALVLCAMAALAFVLALVLRKDWRVLLAPTMYPNTGNMGLPVILYAFGEAGFAFGITVMVTVSLFQFTLGTMLASRGNPLKSLVKTPTVYAILISIALLFTDTELPLWLQNSVDLISGFTVPLMLITLGVSLASIQVRSLRSGVWFSLLRIPLAAGVAWGIGIWLDLPPMALAILVLQMSMPVAVFNYLFAQKSQREPAYVASLVFCSTLLSLIYLPVLLALLL